MGFQAADVAAFAVDLARLDGVTDVWLHQPTEYDATIWVLLHVGDDAERYETTRFGVVQRIQSFVKTHNEAMRHASFLFDYHVLGAAAPHEERDFPEGSKRIAA